MHVSIYYAYLLLAAATNFLTASTAAEASIPPINPPMCAARFMELFPIPGAKMHITARAMFLPGNEPLIILNNIRIIKTPTSPHTAPDAPAENDKSPLIVSTNNVSRLPLNPENR